MNGMTVHNEAPITRDGVRELVDDWQRHLELQVMTGELSEHTMRAYVRGWERFYAWWKDDRAVDGDALRVWIAELREKGYKPNTVNSFLAGVRALFSWAVGRRRLLVNPAEGVKGVKRRNTQKKHLRDVLTNGEVLRVLSQPDRATERGKRDYAILALKAYAAVRDIELQRADLSDLRTMNGVYVLFVQGKGQQDNDGDYVVLTPPAEDAVLDWLGVRGGKPGPLFVSMSNRAAGKRLTLRSIRRIVKDAYRAAGIFNERKTSHSLRHTAITTAIRRGAPIQKVKNMARHTSIETTMIYYHEVDRLDDPAEGYIQYSE